MLQETIELPNWVSVGGVLVKEVVVEEMTGIEEDILFDATKKSDSSGRMAKGGPERISEILSRCTVKMGGKVRPDGKSRDDLPGFFQKEWDDAPTNDRVFALARIRMISIGPIVKHDTVKCDSCEKEIENVVSDLRKQEVTSIPIPENEEEFYKFKLPRSGWVVDWRPVSGADGENSASRLVRVSRHELISALMALKVQKIDGKPVSPEEAKRRFRSLTSADRQALREEIDSKEGGLDVSVKVTCDNPECGATVDTKIEVMGQGFFIPSGTKSPQSSTSS